MFQQSGCVSAWGPDADTHGKQLKLLRRTGALDGVELQSPAINGADNPTEMMNLRVNHSLAVNLPRGQPSVLFYTQRPPDWFSRGDPSVACNVAAVGDVTQTVLVPACGRQTFANQRLTKIVVLAPTCSRLPVLARTTVPSSPSGSGWSSPREEEYSALQGTMRDGDPARPGQVDRSQQQSVRRRSKAPHADSAWGMRTGTAGSSAT